MLVRAADGSRLGRVYATTRDSFWVRPRFRKTPQYAVLISSVKSLAKGEVILRGGSELLVPIDPGSKPEPLLSVRGLSGEEQAALSAR